MDSPFFFDQTRYWSEGDEKAHFDWLGRIACIQDVRGRGTQVVLTIDPTAVTAADMIELCAIYRRYGGDLEQLQSLEESSNAQD
ncbi:hypothetical protein [Sphingomonas sp. Mn802worker]|uniref:hypothetical protein n=1 Tax=Sphingomonas sp. Mn802worker TaxID=629773 RepID=UPI0012EA67FF|nr:hypothetical protein [Sphingomonas sp. Mn802worker]